MQSNLTAKRRNVKSSRKPAPRKPIVRCCDATELVNPEPECSLDYAVGSLAATVEALLELDERDRENAMIAQHENDPEVQYLESLERDWAEPDEFEQAWIYERDRDIEETQRELWEREHYPNTRTVLSARFDD